MPDMTAAEAAEILKVLEKVSFCDAAHEAYACRYPETGCSDCEWQIAKNKIQNVFRAISAGEYKRVVHAHWKLVSEGAQCNLVKCTHCGRSIAVARNVPLDEWRAAKPYCDQCGALMNGKSDDHA